MPSLILFKVFFHSCNFSFPLWHLSFLQLWHVLVLFFPQLMAKLTCCSEPTADRAMATCNSSKHRGAVHQGGPGGSTLHPCESGLCISVLKALWDKPMLKHTQAINNRMCLRVCETKCSKPSSGRLLQHLLHFKQISCYTDSSEITRELKIKYIFNLLH